MYDNVIPLPVDEEKNYGIISSIKKIMIAEELK